MRKRKAGFYHAYAPDGTRIIGTDDLIPGTGQIQGIEIDDKGELSALGADDTDMCWDAQETRTEFGEPVYIDDAGVEWLESELVLVYVPDEDNPPVPSKRRFRKRARSKLHDTARIREELELQWWGHFDQNMSRGCCAQLLAHIGTSTLWRIVQSNKEGK